MCSRMNFDRFFSVNIFGPFGEVVHYHDDESKSSGCRGQRTDNVNSPLHEGPRLKDDCELLGMGPNKCRLSLVVVTFLRIIGSILLHRGLKESLQQSLVCEGLPPYVILTDSVMDLAEDFFGFLVVRALKQQC